METITKTNIGTGAVGVLAVLSLIISMGGAPDMGNWYYGIDNQSNIICGPLQCDKLSAQNDLGISSRCYFFSEEKNRTTYKTCKSGWVKFENVEKSEQINFSETDHVYLYCMKGKNSLVSECQVIDNNQTIFKLENS